MDTQTNYNIMVTLDKRLDLSTLQRCCNEMIRGWTSNIKLEREDNEFKEKETLRQQTQELIDYLSIIFTETR